MSKKTDKRGLGRGLSALLGDTQLSDVPVSAADTSEVGLSAKLLPIDRIDANPDQPRRQFGHSELDELAASIRERGVIQPIIVRPHPSDQGRYQLVAGERRWRAAQRAPLHEIPAIVRDLAENDVLELAIIENVQRVDLSPIEEAQGYAQLIERFDYTQEALAQIMGKSRSYVANALRLLSLPDSVQGLVNGGKLSAGHARALVSASDPVALAEKAVSAGLTVRQVEDLARRVPRPVSQPAKPAKLEKDADTRLLEGDLSAAIGMKVSIEHLSADGGGELRIRYRDLDQLDQLCRKLGE